MVAHGSMFLHGLLHGGMGGNLKAEIHPRQHKKHDQPAAESAQFVLCECITHYLTHGILQIYDSIGKC